MSQRVAEGLLGRLITDRDFRTGFYQDPKAFCLREALELTDRELEAILAIDGNRLEELASRLDARIVRASLLPYENLGRLARVGRRRSPDSRNRPGSR
jgi:hypothetical protein